MTDVALVLVAGAVSASVVLLALWTSPRVRWRRRAGRVVVVHLTTGASLDGLVVEKGRDALVLSGASYLDTGDALAGETLVPWEQVAFIQFLSRET